MPLQLACINENHIAVVQYLIDRGADVNAQRWSKKHVADKSQAVAGATGSTALHVACANGCTKIVDLLLRNGAKINVKDKYGSKPIDVAAAKNHVEIVKLLDTFGSMQQMLKGLQEGQPTAVKKAPAAVEEVAGRRSMDASLYSQQQQKSRAERLRRPSLPSVFESQKLDIPDISTLPTRHSTSGNRPSPDELSKPKRYQNYFQPTHSYSQSDLVVDEPLTTDNNRQQDWYSYGVVNHYEDENYLASLERRAYGLDETRSGRSSFDGNTKRPTNLDSAPLKRCSSDVGHLRTTALMNAMAANNISLQDDEFGNVIQVDDEEDEENDVVTDEFPRPTLYDERPALEQLEKVKKSWWSSGTSGNSTSNKERKSMDIYPTGRPSLENNNRTGRTSLDFRPSFDGLSQLAKKSMEGLSRKSIDTTSLADFDPEKKPAGSKGFLSKWWSTSTTAPTAVDRK